MNLVYLYLLSPLHTGGTTQEGNLLGIARESHTDLPYIPSSTVRGKLRSSVGDRVTKVKLFGPDLKDVEDTQFVSDYQTATQKKLSQLEQGDIWIGDGSLLWLPIPSLSHGVIWISSPLLLRRWARFDPQITDIPAPYSVSPDLANSTIYLKDAILKSSDLTAWNNWQSFIPETPQKDAIARAVVLPDQHCATLIQMGLWRQVKVKLDQHKSVEGGFRYEEAIPPDTLMYFSWGLTSQTNGTGTQSIEDFKGLINAQDILQIGGQESLGRGFVQQWLTESK